jgi:DNA adenine methylase
MGIGYAKRKCYVTPKQRGPTKVHGGKNYLARRFLSHFPEHSLYVEPFLGGGTVLLNRVPGVREVAGDINGPLIEFWQTLQGPRGGELIQRLRETPYAEASFERAKGATGGDVVDCAWRFVVRNRMSRGGLGKDFAWSERLRGKRQPGGPVPGDLNAWRTILDELPRIRERVRRVEFVAGEAIDLIFVNDGLGTLFYCDPPYLHETRTHTKTYGPFEMDLAAHERLLDMLLVCKGKVFISGYPSDLYDRTLKGWTRRDFNLPNHSGQGKKKNRRIECLWESP